ncbi:MAG: cytochrome c [Leptothrix sp. (in: b-proteobacteria)]
MTATVSTPNRPGAAPQASRRSTHLMPRPRPQAPLRGRGALLSLAALLSATALLGACADLSRSRDLGNPAVPATTLAQQVCSNCHGLGGTAVSPVFPNLAGQVEAYTVAQLKGFKGHGRQDPAGFEYMWGLSRSLSDAQIDGLASYYAAQVPVRQPVEAPFARIAAGQPIFETGLAEQGVPACSSCHGDQAQGQAMFPRLAGQHADYLVKQLLVFQRTDERPEGSVMKTVAHALTPQNISDVAAYLQALPNR